MNVFNKKVFTFLFFVFLATSVNCLAMETGKPIENKCSDIGMISIEKWKDIKRFFSSFYFCNQS